MGNHKMQYGGNQGFCGGRGFSSQWRRSKGDPRHLPGKRMIFPFYTGAVHFKQT
jgi:hypothetical protein